MTKQMTKRTCLVCGSTGRYTGEISLKTEETWYFHNEEDCLAMIHQYGDHNGDYDEHKRWLDTPRPHGLFRCSNGHEWWLQGKSYEDVSKEDSIVETL